jgi:hypothetical protein
MGLLGCSGRLIQSRSGHDAAAAFAIDRRSAITALTPRRGRTAPTEQLLNGVNSLRRRRQAWRAATRGHHLRLIGHGATDPELSSSSAASGCSYLFVNLAQSPLIMRVKPSKIDLLAVAPNMARVTARSDSFAARRHHRADHHVCRTLEAFQVLAVDTAGRSARVGRGDNPEA